MKITPLNTPPTMTPACPILADELSAAAVADIVVEEEIGTKVVVLVEFLSATVM